MKIVELKNLPADLARHAPGRVVNRVPRTPAIFFFGVLGLGLFAIGCEQKSAAVTKKAEPPANVPNIPKEDKLNEFELTPKAEERLGIVTTPIEKHATV